ncbi:MAG: hypothetical protein K2N18_04325, partial [Clostridia bacterium]|nr:hypothetical protein [Clostridia bacterium]
MVGYGPLSSYEFFEDGSVALNSKFYAPLKNSRTGEGFVASLSVERRDGVFDVMTESANTGALLVITDDKSLDIRTRHRIYVVGVDDETSYLIVSGVETSSGSTTYYERRYLIPLGGYCTGAPLKMQAAYYKNAYYITVTDGEGTSIFKKIDKDTAFTENPGFSSNMKSFFESEKVERVLGLESLDYKAKFSSVEFKLGDANAAPYAVVPKHTVTAVNTTPDGGSISVSDENPYKGEAVTVTVKPNDGYYLSTFTVDGVNSKYRLYRAAEGAYEYEIIGVQKDMSVEVVYAEGTETTYAVTGTYAYTSGMYNSVTDKFENEGDEVSVSAGIYEGTAENGTFGINLPAEYCEIKLSSKKFPAAEKAVTIEGAEDIGEIK